MLLAVLCCAAALLLLLPPFIRALVAALSVLDASPSTAALFFLVVLLLCSPFTLGYGVVVLTAGVVLGWWAFPLVYAASVLGGALWFVLFRALSNSCQCNVSSLLFSLCPAYSLYLRAFTSALDAYPVRSAALLQLSFLPFGALCALLSSTELRLSNFVAACCLSRLKLLAYVSLAQSAGTVHQLWTRDQAASPARWQDALSLCVSVVCSVVALSAISILASRQLKRMREDGSGSTPYSALQSGGEAKADEEERRRLAAEEGDGELRASEYNRLLSPRNGRGGGSEAVRLDVREVEEGEEGVRHFVDGQQVLALHDAHPIDPSLSPQLDALPILAESARARKLSGSTLRGALPPLNALATNSATGVSSSSLPASVSSLPLRSSSPRRLRADSPSSSRLLLSSSSSSSSSSSASSSVSSAPLSASSRRRPSDGANPAAHSSYPFLLHHSASQQHAAQHQTALGSASPHAQHSLTPQHSPRRKVSGATHSHGARRAGE